MAPRPAVFLVIIGFTGLTNSWGRPVISEFLASSSGESIVDDDGEPSDWIEIHNAGEAAVNLAGYGLTDSPDRVKFVFPEVMLEPEGYLLVFASGKDRSEPSAPLHTRFRLDRSGEYLALSDPQGELITVFDPQYPGQWRGASYGIVGAGAAGYAEFPSPTPGEVNGTPPPVIEATDYSPKPADPAQRLRVTAVVRQTGAPVQEVRLVSRVMFKNEVRKPMLDDGAAPDEMAGNGVYTAEISHRSLFGPLFKPGQMVRWAIEVEDEAGNEARFPPFPDRQSEEYTGTVLAQDPIETQLDVFHWFLEDPKSAERDLGTRSACFFKGELYDNIFTRIRGGTARSWPKKSFKVEFPEDHHCRFDPDLPRVDELNLNATYTDKSYVRSILTTELHQGSGTPSPITFPLRVHQNGEFYSVALFVEQCDRDFLRRNDLDPDGAYYKAHPGSTYTSAGSFEKKTRRQENRDDVTDFIAGLRLKGKELENFLMDNVDIPAQVNFMAGVAITQNIDNSDKNHYLYRDTEASGEWFMTPWDLDLTFGPDALNTDRILANEERRGAANPNAVHPFIGSRRFPLHSGKTNEFLDRMFNNSRTQDMFLRRLRTMHDRFLMTDYFDRRLDELLALFEADTNEDREKWGSQSHFPGRRDSMAVTIERIKTEYLIDRRDFFERGGLVDIPGSMPQEVHLTFAEVEFAPASGNQAEEYIRLKNPNRFAVDLSGWRLLGAVEHEFRPGTVIPQGSLFAVGRNELYVVKDAAAFRRRTEGPSGGKGLFVQGNYRGSLSSLGEEIRILNDSGELIVSQTYEGDPSDWQKYLVISEVMVAPHNPEAEFIELANTGESTLDLTGVRFTRGVDFSFAQGTALLPGEYLLVVRNRAAFEGVYGSGLPIAGEFARSTRLNNGGESIKLEDPANNTIAEFRYGDEEPWPDVTGGHSLVYDIHGGRRPEDGRAWAASAEEGGAPNAEDGLARRGPGLLSLAFGSERPAATLDPVVEGENHFYELAYPVEETEGLAFSLERSADLQTWVTDDTEPSILGGGLRFRVRAGGSSKFLRVRVELHP